ncbi:flagellar biosynthesis protein FlgL [Novosphingobium sp. PC22D]|uniref:flagellin N-terminal helical domain-containing protein n=1 Tax=Novosphingobium sp. PC22D TaxID=1962403 RepID=UPI000BEF2B14|nr:flagellar biosynthesis protein FlgL [Novosphingobium sp. PC22D]PEQ14448.1 flagellar biosynthesis protein FlgL [Novosphingobium sp. PC22D]
MPIISTSTGAFFERARQDIKGLRAQAETIQSQLGSGERMARSSDDPVAASRLRTLARADSLSRIDTANADRAESDLSLADGALSDISRALGRAKELATQAANDTLSDSQRASIGAELDSIEETLFSLANARDSNGKALFGGEGTGAAYVRDAAGNAVYVGTASSSELPLGEGLSVARSLTGPEFLNFNDAAGNPTDLMAVVKTLSDALKGAAADPAGAARAALDTLANGLDAVTTGQTVVGTRLAWIDVVGERRIDLSEMRAAEEADVGSIEIGDAVTRLQQAMVVLEASQASFSKLSGLSLFNQLR